MENTAGTGIRAAFDNLGVYGPQTSLSRDSYGNFENCEVNTAAAGKGARRDYQATTFAIGDGTSHWSTTSGDAHRAFANVEQHDPRAVLRRRAALTKSTIGEGQNYETVKTSSMTDAIQPHPEYRPPAPARTAFESHQQFKNWDGSVTKSTTHEDFGPKDAEIVIPVHHNDQETTATFGNSRFNETESMYSASFKAPERSVGQANDRNPRYEREHHAIVQGSRPTGRADTTYASTFVEHKGVKPAQPCGRMANENHVTAMDPRYIQHKSSMQQDFVEHRGAVRTAAATNRTNESHIRFEGSEEPWKTSSSDYFLWRDYRLPGRPF
jgi:hypothetical protein